MEERKQRGKRVEMKRQEEQVVEMGPPDQLPTPQTSGMQELGRGEARSCEPRTTELPANSQMPGELGWWLGGLWNIPFLPPGFSQAEVSQPGHH